MNNKQSSTALFKTITSILSVPTTTFHEQWLSAEIVRRIKKLKSVKLEQDAAGNIFVKYLPAKSAKLCLQAHLDHPGYVVRESEGPAQIAEAYGGVPKNCVGGTLRFFSKPSTAGQKAKITKAPFEKDGRYFIEFSSSKKIPEQAIGMWDFPVFKKSGDWFEGRSLDDNLCVGVLMHLLERASAEKWKEPFALLFTRAEEEGFIGTHELLAKRSFKLPKTIITLEVPRENGALVASDGVMVRVGDRNLCYDPALIFHLESLALELTHEDKTFKYQKRLGLAGGIESTVFSLHGYTVASICVAVQHGHNIDLTNQGRPAPERVHRGDLLALATLIQSLLNRPFNPGSGLKDLKKRLDARGKKWAPELYSR